MFKTLSTYVPYTETIVDVTADAITLSGGTVLQPASIVWYLSDAQDLVERSVESVKFTPQQLSALAQHEQDHVIDTLEVPMFTLNPNRLKGSGVWNITSIDKVMRTIVLESDGDRVVVTWMDFWCRIPEYQREQIMGRMTNANLKNTLEELRQQPQWKHNKPKEAFTFARKLGKSLFSFFFFVGERKRSPWLRTPPGSEPESAVLARHSRSKPS